MVYEMLHFRYSTQNLNAKGLTEDEIIGPIEYVPFNVQVVMFLVAQVYEIKKNLLF